MGQGRDRVKKSIQELRAEQAALRAFRVPAWIEDILKCYGVKVVAVRPSGSKKVAKREGST